MMNKRLVAMLVAFAGLLAGEAQVSFSGNGKPVYEAVPSKNTGLDKIYVLYTAAGVSMSYKATTDAAVKWYAYGESGGGYATEIDGVVRAGNVTTLPSVAANSGYIIEEGTKRTYLWVTDYSKHRLSLKGLSAEPASDCGTATLKVEGSGSDMAYYTITGVRKTLEREMHLTYKTLAWNDENQAWEQTDADETEDEFKNTIVIPAPLCNTTFELKGDKYLEFWGEGERVATSDVYETAAVDVKATAEQEQRDVDNEKKNTQDESALGGSAPVKITFKAYPTDAVVHKEWQMATDADFNNIELRLGDETVEQTFEEAGTYYWRFFGANSDGSCETYSDVYTVNIGTSELLCPNVFSPGSSEGVNDVWKVSYKSIVKFKCWIYNRWGNQITVLDDPSQGWDGTYGGKLVKPGVYYYVIRATGADGKKYKLKGDINIIRYKSGLGGGTSQGDADSN